MAGFEGREVRGASDEIVYVNGRATSLVGAGGRERTEGVYFEDLVRLFALFLNLGGRFRPLAKLRRLFRNPSNHSAKSN